jgi:hypothetical protein
MSSLRSLLVLQMRACLIVFALQAAPLMAQPSPQSGSTASRQTKPATQPTLTPDEKEAQFHYKVALTALKNNDLEIATKELEQAAKLAPNNALVQYNLAIVTSKRGKPAEAVADLKRAIDLGLPSTEAAQADDLLVQLTYEVQKTAVGEFSWLIGTWVANFTTHLRYRVQIGANYSVMCTYSMAATSTLVVINPPDHPDRLEGSLTFHAQGFGDVSSVYHRPIGDKPDQQIEVCLTNFGKPVTFVEDATMVLGVLDKNGKDESGNTRSPALGDALVEFYLKDVRDCGRYCNGWDSVSDRESSELDKPSPLVFKVVDNSRLEPATLTWTPADYTVYTGSSAFIRKSAETQAH